MLIEVQFLADFASSKKGDFLFLDSKLVSRLKKREIVKIKPNKPKKRIKKEDK